MRVTLQSVSAEQRQAGRRIRGGLLGFRTSSGWGRLPWEAAQDTDGAPWQVRPSLTLLYRDCQGVGPTFSAALHDFRTAVQACEAAL